MSWHEHLSVEVALEFMRLYPHPELYEELLWFHMHCKRLSWKLNGQLWKRSAYGRRYNCRKTMERYWLLKATPDGWAKCKACGKQFAVSVMQRRKGRTKACSYSCAGKLSAARKKRSAAN